MPSLNFCLGEQSTWEEVLALSMLAKEVLNVGTNYLLIVTLILYSDNILILHFLSYTTNAHAI